MNFRGFSEGVVSFPGCGEGVDLSLVGGATATHTATCCY